MIPQIYPLGVLLNTARLVDSGALGRAQSEILPFLEASPTNAIVIPNIVILEFFRGQAAPKRIKSLSFLAPHVDQIFILLPAVKIASDPLLLTPISTDLLDEKLTTDFRYIFKILEHRCANEAVSAIAAFYTKHTDSYFDSLTKSAATIKADILAETEQFPKDGLVALRAQRPVNDDTLRYMINSVISLSAEMLSDLHGEKSEILKPRQIIETLHFRFVLCAYTMELEWRVRGGLNTAKDKTVRNDVTDSLIAAQSMYFDGLITNDDKLKTIHAKALWALNFIFRPLAGRAHCKLDEKIEFHFDYTVSIPLSGRAKGGSRYLLL